MKKSIVVALLAAALLLSATGCGEKTAVFDAAADYETIAEQAKGQTVSFYGWGGDEELNRWIDTELAPTVKEKYDITLERVPMDIDQILSKLAGEKQANTQNGAVDMIWINGENFYSTKENGLLFGPFADKLPNYTKYVDAQADYARMDFGYPIDGYESPYCKAGLVLIKDETRTPETPKNTQEFLEFAQKYKGKVTYPALPDFTGSGFVRSVIYELVGYDALLEAAADKETVRKIIAPATEYLKQLNPYLWNEGKTFPATLAQMDNMFADGELYLSMNYSAYAIAGDIANGTYPETAQSFVFDGGMVGNTNYIAIAANSPHKAGAMVVINEVLSPAMQATKLEQTRQLPATEYDQMNAEEKALFDQIDLGLGIIPQDALLENQVQELPANLVPIIEEIWLEEVVGK